MKKPNILNYLKKICQRYTIGSSKTSAKIISEATRQPQLDLKNYFEVMETLFNMIPHIFWKGRDGRYLGCNLNNAKAFHFNSVDEFIGTTIFDFLDDPEHAKIIDETDREIMNTGKVITIEESFTTSGKMKTYLSQKQPIYDHQGTVIGLLGYSMDITQLKEREKLEKEKTEQLIEKLKLLENMNKITSLLPVPIYWEDVNSVILGANDYVIEELGVKSLNDFVGKSLYELYPKEMADHIKQHNEEVMRTGQVMSQEEAIIDMKGRLKWYAAIKAPLRDENGNIIGIVGTSINITQQKEAERLKRQEQEKFNKLANQVAHDIRSPLASLLMIVKSCSHIPEADRIALREAAIGISDIANHLLNQYQKKETDIVENEERQAVLVSAALLESLTAKKYQYQKLPIKFDCHFKTNTQFAFIKIKLSAFKRMLSNLINNAVDAMEHNTGTINLQLVVDNEWVKISIQDSGKGMSSELIAEIMSQVSITRGKKSGHGIGLTQVWDTLEHNQGELHIESELGTGTTITLSFPRMPTPYWIAEKMLLNQNDIVVILDDDTSIHGAWRARFEAISEGANAVQLQHFEQAREALSYIQALAPAEKERLFLLTDYELLKQEFNGLEVITQSQIKRSILVTSHYADPLVQEQAAKTDTKILPKQLASEIPIYILETEQQPIMDNTADIVFVDNDKLFVQALTMFIFKDQHTAQYYNPQHFLDNAHLYPKGTKIYLDNNFSTSNIKGIDIARELHVQGYTQLYLLSGEVFNKEDIPSYLTVIRKDDIAAIKSL